MASRTLLEPGRETRRRDETVLRARERAPAAAPARRAGRTDRGGLPRWWLRFIRPTRPTSRCATPTTSPRSTWGWSGSAWCCSSGWTSPSARGAARGRGGRRARRCAQVRRERWTPARSRGRRHRAAELLPHLHGLPEPQERRPAAAAGRPLRPPARRPRPRHVRRPRPGRRCCTRSSASGSPTHVLSTAYAAFIVFLPLSLAVALVFSRDLRAGLFYATALSVNWVLGAASYFLLPSLGPIYYEPQALRRISRIPRSPGSRTCCSTSASSSSPHPDDRAPRRAIAAFASLHISMSLTAALAAHLLGLGPAAEDRAVGLVRPHDRSPPSTSAGTTSSTTSPAWRSPSARCWSPARSPASTCARCGSRRARRSRRPTDPDGEQRQGREHRGGRGDQEPRGARVGALPDPVDDAGVARPAR